MSRSELENFLIERGLGKALDPSQNINERQALLDEITPVIMRFLSPQDIVEHNQRVYDATAQEYISNPHTTDVIDEIVEFMYALPAGARVLDVGCGWGRDSFFLTRNDIKYRLAHMNRPNSDGKTTREKFGNTLILQKKKFEVTGIDTSRQLLQYARTLIRPEEQNPPVFVYEDMHNIAGEDIGYFDGIWACTSLFTHTPWVLLEPAMKSIAEILKTYGLFSVSYINGEIDNGRYNRLRASSTGHVKYFSQPDPNMIQTLAKKYDLHLIVEFHGDHPNKKNLYITQFFRSLRNAPASKILT